MKSLAQNSFEKSGIRLPTFPWPKLKGKGDPSQSKLSRVFRGSFAKHSDFFGHILDDWSIFEPSSNFYVFLTCPMQNTENYTN